MKNKTKELDADFIVEQGLWKTIAGFMVNKILKMKNNYFVLIIIFLLAGQSELNAQSNKYLNPNLSYGSVIDIDGNTYATIQIGNQTWMAENLRTTKYSDGIDIGIDYFIYNSSENFAIYGLLYNWHAVKTGKLCPLGWHIPTYKDWNQLISYLSPNAGGKLKSTGNRTDGTGLWAKWFKPLWDDGATNESGFTALPGGLSRQDGTFGSIGTSGNWWSSIKKDSYNAWSLSLTYTSSYVDLESFYDMNYGLSCRCLRD
ncbi:MAG: fibrobacter succinogenes major paralogous domain-containing protein [Chitinophagales bacterium]|nr:fibrobacter succinogenes major paralogous domain-containing protein [Chitinophagales bacterium]